MTLPELERLVRRIEEALDGANGNLPKLAQEFHAVGRAAVTRLHQCGEMLGMGDEHQALQLAETQPGLLEVITLLSFRKSPQWRALCQRENLPMHEPFDVKALRRLNETYAKGIDQDHALYRDYRRAIMMNEDARALVILRSIVRLNPNDNNARGELERFEKKQRVEKGRRLEALVKAGGEGSTEEIVQLAGELEGERESVVWEKAQTVRVGVLLARAREGRKGGNLREVVLLMEKIRALSFLLESEERAELEELSVWTEEEQRRRNEAAGRRAAVDHVAALAQRLEQEQFGGRRPLVDVRAALESLERAWRQVERFRSEVSSDLATRVTRLMDGLRLEIERRVRASRLLAFAGVGVVVMICLGAAWWGYSRQAASSLATRLNAMMGERRVAEAEAALQSASNQVATAALADARAHAVAFLEKERALKVAVDREVQRVELAVRQGFTNAAPEQIAASFQTAKSSIAAAAPEFRGPALAALGKVEGSWSEFVDREKTARSARLLALLEPLEKEAKERLVYSLAPNDGLRVAQDFGARLGPARRLTESEILRPRQEPLFRLQTLEAQVQKFARDATNWSAAHTALAVATNWDGFNAGLQMLISSGFTPAAQRTAAAAMAGMNLSSPTLLGPLLLSNGPGAALLEPPRLARTPEEVLPAELEVQRQLREDRNIHDVMRMDVELKTENPRRQRRMYVMGEMQRRITRRSGQIYDPSENSSTLNFTQKELGLLEYNFEEPAVTAEKELYERIGLPRLLDSAGKYQVGLLQVLDDINQDRRASPLFRAYLFGRVCEMMDAQPTQWGAVWSPSLARDRAALKGLGAEQIHSGEWLVPATTARFTRGLSSHFEQASLRSYAREAAFFKRLLPGAMQVGVKPVGYVSADGEVRIAGSRRSDVWGLTAPGSPAVLILENGEKRAQGHPFSPLFVLAGNAAELVNSTLQTLSYSAGVVGAPESLPEILKR